MRVLGFNILFLAKGEISEGKMAAYYIFVKSVSGI